MSEPYVSILEPETDALRTAMEALDLKPVEAVIKKASDELYQHLIDSASCWFGTNLAEYIDGAARDLARRYLAEALAGDEEKLRKLFGLWRNSPATAWSLRDERPHYRDDWVLLRALCEKFPDLLRTELTERLELEIAAVREENGRLRTRNEELQARL